jgi:transcriptional regulator with XRE-family HTH domain
MHIFNWKTITEMQDLSDILPLLRSARQKDDRTQAQLAIHCHCSQGHISRILAGKIAFMHPCVYRLCDCLGVPYHVEPVFDLCSHLERLETIADSRQQELILVIRHAYDRLQIPRAGKRPRPES